ncbi:chaperonin [Culex quinquefasciatus]|uniref:Chaperonin n=1 Tax=Culex quinquefasciatus TaxID=7176 RepID=B0WWW4_CULQU|nr:chaperonin [Culex quinquefasciatus]|eukprot:XP_001861886.1 chaperonin [Culex quinquefasciatus]
MSRFQDDEVGNGMTFMTVLVAAKQAPKLFAGCCLEDSFLDKGFLLDKKTVVHKPKRIMNAKILIANTPMDTDKIKDSMVKIAELEVAEKEKMKDKVITRTRLVSVVAICSKVCIDVITRSNINRTRCRNFSQGGKLLPNRNFAPKFYGTFRCQRSIDILLGIGILVRLAAKQSGALQLENLKFKVLLSAADENLEKLSSNSSGKSRLGMRCGKVKEQHLHAGLFLPSLSPIEETVPRNELTGYDWFILMRKKITHWRKAHLIPPHLNHSLSP